MNRSLQPGMHPDADHLSVFVEGSATAHEQQKMLAHLADCAECRHAVFLMQPHEEPQRVTAAPEKGRMWRWLVPVGLPAAALACGLIAVLVYVRPHGGAPQKVASVKAPEIERPGTSVPSTPNADNAASTANLEPDTRSKRRQNDSVPKAAATDATGQTSRGARGATLGALEKEQAVGGAVAQTTAAAPSASVQTADSALAQSTIDTSTVSELPLNGRNVMDLQQLSAQAGTAGISGRITDRTGAVIARVTVTLRDAAGKTRQTTTGEDGSFRLSDLPPGQYGLTAAAAGFKTNQQSIELKPSELAMLEPKMDVGMASEVVEVTGAAVTMETESASLSSQRVSELPRAIPSSLPVAATVSHGKRFLSLDSAGNLFLSHNGGKKWKAIKPQWTGKALRIELAPANGGEALAKDKNETSGAASEEAGFLLTTDGGTVWTSKDGSHWRLK